ncbi:MAG TPA: class I SAM-dependent methyltransferase, partial [Acidimicrobiales bacterium]|nr:class I SAM-dependent methyltransferase [Acidimicrobiales bacterium]
MTTGGLPPSVAATVYDRIGRFQNTQAPIERAAVERLITAGALHDAGAVFELGCGTGKLARRLLAEVLPGTATYLGGDVSPRMVALARRQVAPWSSRAEVVQLDGTLPLPGSDRSVNRFIAAYVFDLLEHDYAKGVLRDAHRLLAEGG